MANKLLFILLSLSILTSCNMNIGSVEVSEDGVDASFIDGPLIGSTPSGGSEGVDDGSSGGESHGSNGELTKQPKIESFRENVSGKVVTFKFTDANVGLKLHYLKVAYKTQGSNEIQFLEKTLFGDQVIALESNLPHEIEIDLGATVDIQYFIVGPAVDDAHTSFYPRGLEILVDKSLVMKATNLLRHRPMNLWVDFVDTKFIPKLNKQCPLHSIVNHEGNCEPIIHLCSDKPMASLSNKPCYVKADGQPIDCYWVQPAATGCLDQVTQLGDLCEKYSPFVKSPGTLFQGIYNSNKEVISRVCTPTLMLQDGNNTQKTK